VWMVHNGIEYRVMAAYAEGLSILRSANVGKQSSVVDAENHAAAQSRRVPVRDEPLRHCRAMAPWKRDRFLAVGSHSQPPVEDPNLSKFPGHVSDSREGRWTINAAIDEAVPAPVLTASLYERFSWNDHDSQRRHQFQNETSAPSSRVVVVQILRVQ